MQTTNRTKTKPFTALGTHVKVFIDDTLVKEGRIIPALDHITNNPQSIKAFTVSRINGIVKVYIARKKRNIEVGGVYM